MHRHSRLKQRKCFAFSSLEKLCFSRKGDMPGWSIVVGMVLAIIVLIFLIWLALRSGKAGVDVISELP